MEQDLFSRIRNLEAQLAYGLPPQLNPGEYEQQIRNELNTAVSIRDYAGILSRELQEMQIMELKRDLQERLFHFMISEPRLESFFNVSPYRDIREEAYDFLEEKAEHNIYHQNPAMRHSFQRSLLHGMLRNFFRDIEENCLNSAIYKKFLSHFSDEK